MTIINYKTITIAIDSFPTTFSIPTFLQFVPTHFIVRACCYNIQSAANSTDRIIFLKTSLLNNEPIFVFVRDNLTSSTMSYLLELKFKINPSVIGGNYDFTLCNIAGGEPDQLVSIKFALTIEFVEEI